MSISHYRLALQLSSFSGVRGAVRGGPIRGGRGRGRGGYNNQGGNYGPGPSYEDGPGSYGQYNDGPPEPYYAQNQDYGDPYGAYDSGPPMYNDQNYGSYEGALS